jgi:hypothetical protein
VVCGKSPPNWGCLTHIYGFGWVWKGFLNLHDCILKCFVDHFSSDFRAQLV